MLACVQSEMPNTEEFEVQGIMGVFMREPLLDWQREARVVNAKRSLPGNAKDPVSAAEAADPADMHVNLKVNLLTGSVLHTVMPQLDVQPPCNTHIQKDCAAQHSG